MNIKIIKLIYVKKNFFFFFDIYYVNIYIFFLPIK